MLATVYPSYIHGNVTAPSSKSLMQRACILALLNNGNTTIGNPGFSADDRACVEAIKTLGARVEKKEAGLEIYSSGKLHYPAIINCGESGLTARMIAAVCSMSENKIMLTGEGSLLKRDFTELYRYFEPLGVQLATNEGRLPLTIQGPVRPDHLNIENSGSSQYLTGLLPVLALTARDPVKVSIPGAVSIPYLDLTVQAMRLFGYEISHQGPEFSISPKSRVRKDVLIHIEGDWSGAAFLMVAAAIAGEISLDNLNGLSLQGDKAIADILRECGARIEVNGNRVLVAKSPLKSFSYDATHTPDLFPPLAVLALYCNGTSRIKGIHRLKNKESSRDFTLFEMIKEVGGNIALEADEMVIRGPVALKGGRVSAGGDHRIAMAAAIAALGSTEGVDIEGFECIDKSYPSFADDLRLAGARLTLAQ